MALHDPGARSWGADTAVVRQARRGKRRGWLTTPQQLLSRARQLDKQAVSSLWTIYRLPMESFLQQRGASRQLAEDVTQGFFLGLWHRKDFAKLEPEGSFGGWLRSGALHHLYNERKRANSKKRRLGEEEAAELRAHLEERQLAPSDRLLDQRRAAELIEAAWARLRGAYRRSGSEVLFDHLKQTLSRDDSKKKQAANLSQDAALCEQLGRSADYVAVRRFRLKNEEFPAALLAELNERRLRERSAGQARRAGSQSVREELRALLDALT